MRKTTALRGALLLAAAGAAGGFALRPGGAAAPERLTPATYEAIRAKVAPTAEEMAWQQVPWREGFFEGLLAAQAADRPLFYWLYEGDPLANC